MKHHFYDLKTGVFNGVTYTGPLGVMNVPDGLGVVAGDIDHLSQRLDLATGELVDHQPPKPDDTIHTAYDWDAETKRWVGLPTRARIAATVRADRHARLAACDWVVIRARETGTPVPPEWADYREALRDITDQFGFPGNVNWPTAPD